jgi:hypothetical protein
MDKYLCTYTYLIIKILKKKIKKKERKKKKKRHEHISETPPHTWLSSTSLMQCDCESSNSLSASVDLKRGTGKWVADELPKNAYGLPQLWPSGIAEEVAYWTKEELLSEAPKKPIFLLRWWTMVLDLIITDEIAMKNGVWFLHSERTYWWQRAQERNKWIALG